MLQILLLFFVPTLSDEIFEKSRFKLSCIRLHLSMRTAYNHNNCPKILPPFSLRFGCNFGKVVSSTLSQVIFPKTDEQRKRLSESVKGIFLFRSLDQVNIDEYVIKQGDDGDNFYIIESGIYDIYVLEHNDEKYVGKYENSGSFGELALMYNMPRAASIKAKTPGSLWAMDRITFRRILLKNAFKKRKMYEALLESVPVLKALESYERMNLADALVPKTFEAEEQIIHQGDAADGMYFIEDGTVKITMIGEDGTEREVSRITKGGYFGELALVAHKPRAASAFAVGKVRLAFLDVQAFERLLGPCMEIMKRSIEDYEEQLIKIFGSQTNLSDAR
uniref:Cyclic nucleotide-binding domain-containing protein n=1 Tax=Strigamia maritima TaxID=126957 RepID=T1JFA3_STRMM